MTGRIIRSLPVVPSGDPIQLVLGLDGIGIARPKRKRRRGRHPWLRPPVERAA